MDKKLREFAALIRSTKNLPDTDRFLALRCFVTKRDRAPSWHDRLPDAQKSLWGEAWAILNVPLSLAYEALSMSPKEKRQSFPKGDYPFKWERIEILADELDGTAPNRSTERWLAGVKERLLIMLRSNGEPWTKAYAEECCKGLLESTGPHRDAYKAMATWAIEQGI